VSSVSAQQANTLVVIDPADSPKDYDFTVSGDVSALENPRGDDTSGDSASGTVYGGSDGYSFTGSVVSFNGPGNLELELNGEVVTRDELTVSSDDDAADDPETDDPTTRRIVVEDPDGDDLNDYQFTVSGSLTRADEPEGDDVSGSDASGTVAGGADGYDFTGEITGFSAEGEVNVLIEGETVDPDSFGGSDGGSDDGSGGGSDGGSDTDTETELRIDAVGESAAYDFSVATGLSPGPDVNYNDEYDSVSASGTIGGRGSDNYFIDGNSDAIEYFELTGPAEVYVGGTEVDPDSVGGTPDDSNDETTEPDPPEGEGGEESEIRFNAVGESARIQFSVSGDLTSGEDYDSGTDSISGSSAISTIGGRGSDNYFYTGSVSSFDMSGPAEVLIDGDQVDPSSIGDGSGSGSNGGSDGGSDRGNGVALFIFDDGNETALSNGADVLSDFGYPGTVDVITDRPKDDPDGSKAQYTSYLTIQELEELESMGWEVGSHTVDHEPLTNFSESEQRYQIRESSEWLDSEGFQSATFVYPKGSGNSDIASIVSDYYAIGFGGGGAEPPNYDSKYRIGRYTGHDRSEVLNAIERESQQDGVVPIMIHNVVESGASGNDITKSQLREYARAVEDAGMEVVTGSELTDRL